MMINEGRKNKPLDRYPYMENDLKDRGGCCEDLQSQIDDINEKISFINLDRDIFIPKEGVLITNQKTIIQNSDIGLVAWYGRVHFDIPLEPNEWRVVGELIEDSLKPIIRGLIIMAEGSGVGVILSSSGNIGVRNLTNENLDAVTLNGIWIKGFGIM